MARRARAARCVIVVGIGDNILATGMARGAAERGKMIAFGDGSKIKWDDRNSEIVFRYNRNIARPGQESLKNLEWIAFFKGSRIYNRDAGGRWEWNLSFRPTRGELFFSAVEQTVARRAGSGFVVIEPNVPNWKSVAPNKQWPVERYAEVAQRLKSSGIDVVQFNYRHALHHLPGVREISTRDFRHAAALLARSALYIGPEGGLHHAAAAVGIPAVVLFGGFIPPQVTGYPTHTNLTGGAEACGRYHPCDHCRAAMDAISVDEVMEASLSHLKVAA